VFTFSSLHLPINRPFCSIFIIISLIHKNLVNKHCFLLHLTVQEYFSDSLLWSFIMLLKRTNAKLPSVFQTFDLIYINYILPEFFYHSVTIYFSFEVYWFDPIYANKISLKSLKKHHNKKYSKWETNKITCKIGLIHQQFFNTWNIVWKTLYTVSHRLNKVNNPLCTVCY